jgi:hypothetical protein
MPKKLTAASIASLCPKAQRYEISDNASALRLCVHPSGRKVFVLRYRRSDGKPAKLTLGPFDMSGECVEAPVIGAPQTLAGARLLAATARRALAYGRDPAAERQAARKANSDSAGSNFGDVMSTYVEHCKRRTRGWRETAATLSGLRPMWASRPLASITVQDIFEQIEASLHGLPGRRCWREGPSESRQRQLSARSSAGRWLSAC